MGNKGGFKNVKLGKNVHRQMKRRGPPPVPVKHPNQRLERPEKPKR